MKPKANDQRQDGSALLVALGITLVLSIALASYLSLTLNERSQATRSADWNVAIPVAEAGVEEALTHLNFYGTNNLATNGYWTLGGDGMYHKSRTLPSGTYNTAIQMGTYPTIWPTGLVVAPFGKTNASSTNLLYVKRLVKVTTSKPSGNSFGMLSAGTLTFQGGSVVDAYNSANGPYGAATVVSNAAAIITDSSAHPAVTIQGGATLSGTVTTGPGGTVSNGGILSGTISSNAAVQINDNYPPSWSSNSALYSIVQASGTVGGTNYDVVANNTNYNWLSLTIQGSSKMAVSGNVNIYLGSGGLTVGGSGFIYMNPGSTLHIYTAGNVNITGSGVVNPNADTTACSIIGMNSCTQVTLSGHSNFYGTINAPEAAFTFSGGGTMQAFGSFIVGSATVSGTLHFNINTGGQGYIAQSWNELPAP